MTSQKKKVKIGEPRKSVISFPYAAWLKLRRLQEEGKIRSLQDGVMKALREWLGKI